MTSPSAAAVAVLLLACCSALARAQAQDGQQQDCYSSASIVGAVIGTAVVLLGLEAGAYLLWRLYWRSRRGQHLVLVTDPEKGGEFAFDNPCFKDATPVSKAMLDSKEPAKMDQKSKWTTWGGLGAIKNNLGGLQGEKRRAMDDSFPAEPQVTQVSLRSHDFTGLGFNICGNMRDGIFVKDVLHRGPASESGHIFPGDRIHGIRISLRHMVFEDALTILSYASPYEVTLEVESGTAGASSRPSSLLRREKEKEALAQADRIVHPFYRSQSIADLAQIGKGTQKRAHAVESPSRSPRSETPSDYPTLKLAAGTSAAASTLGMHTSTPHALAPRVEHARLEQGSAVIAPSSNVVMVKPDRSSGVHKLGVRVLPASHEPSEKRQNVHNAYLERGIDVPDGYNPYGPQPGPTTSASAAGFHDVDLGSSGSAPGSPAAAPDKVGVVAKEVKTKISKGLHNLLHSLDRTGKKTPTKDEGPPAQQGPMAAQEATSSRSTPGTASPRASPEAEVEVEVMARQPSGRGIPTEIPEEVRLAAMAARSNRKSLGSLSEAIVAVVEADNRGSSPGASDKQPQQPKRNKGLAPRPPSASPEFPSGPSPPSSPAAAPALVNGEESDSDSECVVTVHSVHQDEEKTRKAASLGDLSRIEDKLSAVAVLERAVSLDLDAPASHGKKRKAPVQPDDDGDLLSLDAVDEMLVARKEPRLDSVGLGLGGAHGLSTFERSRLKKSSDWGTLEEALKDDAVRVTTSSTAPTVAEVIPKSEARNSFFVGMMTRHQDRSDEQPFSISASSLEPLEPLSIEVRGVDSPIASPATPTTATAERETMLWSVPGIDCASTVSVTSPEPVTAASNVSVGMTSVPSDAGEAVSVGSIAPPSVVEDVSSAPVNPSLSSTPQETVSSVSVTSSPAPVVTEAVSTGSSVTVSSSVTLPLGSVSVSSSPASMPDDPYNSGPSSLSSLTIVSSTPLRLDTGQSAGSALQSPIVTSSEILRASGFVSTTQLNSLEDVAFLTAVDSSTLMHDALDDDDDDDDVVPTPSPPDLPSSPMPVSSPMSSLTYVTEIQVTTPEPTLKVQNGFSPSPPNSPRGSSPLASGTDAAVSEVAVRTSTPPAPATPTMPKPATRLNGDVREEPSASTIESTASSSSAAQSALSPAKGGRNVSVTNIQGSRIPVRAASHSPDDRAGRSVATGSAVRPPVPARRSTDPSLSPRKVNGVQAVAHPNDQSP